MVYWTAILYQCLFFIIFSPNWSVVNGNNETTTSSGELTRFSTRIVNGTKVTLGNFAYIVSLRRSGSMNLFCGGSLIKERWILTAAHCMFLDGKMIPASSIVVVGGELQLNPGSFKRQTSGVRKQIIHPTYSDDYLQDDIALLLLESPFKIGSYLQLARLSSSRIPPGTTCVTAGWGYNSEEVHEVSNDLVSVELPILSQAVCRNYLSDIIYMSPNMFCAGYIDGGKDACQGDSGGPFECNGLLTGIVSGGLGCARPKRPGFYTKVKSYTDWIILEIKKNGSSKINSINYSIISLVAFLCIFPSSLFI